MNTEDGKPRKSGQRPFDTAREKTLPPHDAATAAPKNLGFWGVDQVNSLSPAFAGKGHSSLFYSPSEYRQKRDFQKKYGQVCLLTSLDCHLGENTAFPNKKTKAIQKE
jgi:hypothetical protein